MADFCKNMHPDKVVSRLAKAGVFRRYELETIDSKTTTQAKVTQVIEFLQNRDFDGLSEFLRILASVDQAHYQLAQQLQPVRHRVAWFAPSPAHAAAVVYALERYAGAKFSSMVRGGEDKSLVMRRARIFPREFAADRQPKTEVPVDVQHEVTWSHKTEVCLAFPASHLPCDVLPALEKFFAEGGVVTDADMVVTSVVVETESDSCEEEEERSVIVATEVCDEASGEKACAGVEEARLSFLRSLSGKGTGDWIEKERTKLEIDFKPLLCQSQDSKAPITPITGTATTSPCISTSSPVPYRFYQLCQEKFPEKSSLLCHCPAESRAAVTTTCVLMEVCKHFYNNES